MIKEIKLVESFVTCFIGNIAFAPGTFGSILAYPFTFILYKLLSTNRLEIIIVTIFLLLVILFFLGARSATLYINKYKIDDPKEIIIDEVIGQSIVLVSIIPIMNSGESTIFQISFFYLLPLILFRFFDIIKPWPISWFDQNIKGGIGVMLDDVIASIISIIVYYNIYFLIR